MKIPRRRIFSREKIVTLFAIIFNPLSFWNEISDQQGPILYINHWLLTIVIKTMHNIYNLACSTHNLILLFSYCKRILSRVMPCKHSIVFISYIICRNWEYNHIPIYNLVNWKWLYCKLFMLSLSWKLYSKYKDNVLKAYNFVNCLEGFDFLPRNVLCISIHAWIDAVYLLQSHLNLL